MNMSFDHLHMFLIFLSVGLAIVCIISYYDIENRNKQIGELEDENSSLAILLERSRIYGVELEVTINENLKGYKGNLEHLQKKSSVQALAELERQIQVLRTEKMTLDQQYKLLEEHGVSRNDVQKDESRKDERS